jgi:hypothetical protein
MTEMQFQKHCGFWLIVTANVVPSSPIPVTLTKEALHFSETSALTRVTRRNVSEDAILHSLPANTSNLTYYESCFEIVNDAFNLKVNRYLASRNE